MNRIFLIGLCIILNMNIGCSTVKTLDPNYQAYQQAMMTQPPLVEIEWTEDGQRMKKLKVNPQMNIQQKQPEAPHPAWGLATSVVRGLTLVGGIYAGGDALEGVLEAGRGTTTITGSYNTPGGNMAGGDVSIPTTTTTETVTSTSSTESTESTNSTETNTLPLESE